MRVSKSIRERLKKIDKDRDFNEAEIEALLAEYIPSAGKLQKMRVLEAAAIASYHKETGYPIVEVLICDDAPQFKLITENLGLCWVHDGRHYKKLSPVIPYHVTQLNEFLREYWEYYRKLLYSRA